MDDLSNNSENSNESSGNLLATQEKLILEQIAAGEPPHGQRAESLLAIDAGVTQKIAALQSGQTVGQVSYWLSKFRRDRLGIFPEEILHQTGLEMPPSEQSSDQMAPSEGSEVGQGVEKDVKGENSKSLAPEVKPEKKEEPKVKSKADKESKKKRKEKKSPATKDKTKKKKKPKVKSKKAKKGKKKGKNKQAKKSNKEKKKKDKKK